MEPVHYSLQAFVRGVLILGLSLSVFAQIPAAPDASGLPSGRKAPDFPLLAMLPALISHPAFEFRGIRIGDGMKEAEREFLDTLSKRLAEADTAEKFTQEEVKEHIKQWRT